MKTFLTRGFSSISSIRSRISSNMRGVYNSKFTPPSPQESRVSVNSAEPKFKTQSQEHTKKIFSANILGVGNTPQSVKPSPSFDSKGKVLEFSELGEAFVVDSKKSKDYDVIISSGLGGASSERLSFETWFPVNQLFSDKKVALYASITDGDKKGERFTRGLPFYFDQSYICKEESENYFEKVLKPRFFDGDGKLKNKDEIKNFVMVGFSIGAREDKSHVNYLINKFKEYGLDNNQVKSHLEKLAMLNIGSPVHWQDRKLPQEIINQIESGSITMAEAEYYYKERGSETIDQDKMFKIRTINVRSVLDMGTAKPMSDFANFHGDPDLYIPRVFGFSRDESEHMFLLGAGVVRNVYGESGAKNNLLGHNLENYIQSIDQNKKLFSLIDSLFTDGSTLDKNLVDSASYEQKEFDSEKSVDEELTNQLQSIWNREMIERRAVVFSDKMRQYLEHKTELGR